MRGKIHLSAQSCYLVLRQAPFKAQPLQEELEHEQELLPFFLFIIPRITTVRNTAATHAPTIKVGKFIIMTLPFVYLYRKLDI